ncbi:unnamed protein product [Prorocentrum cordatum]|uniref:Ribosome biogenesis protein NOP53 n=1 Tax=Prorocentrum cordatum TaxID=2364126 RepID=A0ABN9SKP1_9DINO|nr:unnamed protein product [Polarella glacialis]
MGLVRRPRQENCGRRSGAKAFEDTSDQSAHEGMNLPLDAGPVLALSGQEAIEFAVTLHEENAKDFDTKDANPPCIHDTNEEFSRYFFVADEGHRKSWKQTQSNKISGGTDVKNGARLLSARDSVGAPLAAPAQSSDPNAQIKDEAPAIPEAKEAAILLKIDLDGLQKAQTTLRQRKSQLTAKSRAAKKDLPALKKKLAGAKEMLERRLTGSKACKRKYSELLEHARGPGRRPRANAGAPLATNALTYNPAQSLFDDAHLVKYGSLEKLESLSGLDKVHTLPPATTAQLG